MGFIDFNDSILFISIRSPFARRVRLAFLENGIQFREKVLDLFKLNNELNAINPLARVPTLQLKSGSILIDSNLILQSFYENVKSDLKIESPFKQLEVYRWQALAVGVCEKIIEFYLETLRLEDYRDPNVMQELTQISARVLDLIENQLKVKNDLYLVGSQLTQADLDMGTALGYMDLRYSTEWKSQFPYAAKYLNYLNERPSFQKTHPPILY